MHGLDCHISLYDFENQSSELKSELSNVSGTKLSKAVTKKATKQKDKYLI